MKTVTKSMLDNAIKLLKSAYDGSKANQEARQRAENVLKSQINNLSNWQKMSPNSKIARNSSQEQIDRLQEIIQAAREAETSSAYKQFNFDTTEEQARAILDTLNEYYPNIRFWVRPVGKISVYALNYAPRDEEQAISGNTVKDIFNSLTIILFAFDKLDRIMSGDDYDYSTQKNFD